MDHLFITGTARSGTTLLCELLDSHPALQLYSQPFPLLFIESKKRFHRFINYQGDRLPLSNYGGAPDYQHQDFERFLNKDVIDKKTIKEVLELSKTYSGTKTPIHLDPDLLKAGTFHQIFSQLVSPQIHTGSNIYTGSKEILCEEFVANFISRGIKCICIIRDPRDILCSMNHGEGHAFTGRIRPTLFNIHNWRKTVHTSIHFRSHPEFLFLKYESLVSTPQQELQKLTQFLDISPFPEFKKENKNSLSSNSSFGNYSSISTQSIGRYKATLPDSVTKYIESTSYAEMNYMGYKPSISPSQEAMSKTVETFSEPYHLKRDIPKPDYSHSEKNVLHEHKRIDFFFGNSAVIPASGIFPDVHLHLKKELKLNIT